jgi:hypothetical protein
MATIPVTCNSCGQAFDADSRKAGQSSPCPHCHSRVEVPDGITARPVLKQGAAVPAAVPQLPISPTANENAVKQAKRLFLALPPPAQFAAVLVDCIVAESDE